VSSGIEVLLVLVSACCDFLIRFVTGKFFQQLIDDKGSVTKTPMLSSSAVLNSELSIE
jgi:hypothetical protein